MLLQKLLADEHGFIISAELVIVATLVVLGMIVGLSEVQHAVVQELNDVGDAIGSLNQSYYFGGMRAWKSFGGWGGGWGWGGAKSMTVGSAFIDVGDSCDWNQCALACDGPTREVGGFGGGGFCGGGGYASTGRGPVRGTVCGDSCSPVPATCGHVIQQHCAPTYPSIPAPTLNSPPTGPALHVPPAP